jgi:hypothetical protein
VYATLFKKYPKPIKTPIHNLRPARETCEQCHWPEKFFGAQLKVFNHYGYDETNTLRQIRLLINTGGGSPMAGPVAGIHWHMNIANEITYVSTDDQRQVIPWVRAKDMNGNVIEYRAEGAQITPEEVAAAPKRQITCVDCHNRPSHIYVPPDRSVNEALSAGRLDVSLPYLKQQAVALLAKPYATTEEAVAAIATGLDQFYRSNYPAVHAGKGDSIRAAVAEVQRIFRTFHFPGMKVDWQTHPDNIGHFYAQGCFRCHDGKHRSRDGKVIRSECTICHTTLEQTEAGRVIDLKGGPFRHPVDLGDMTGTNCADCHSGKGLGR